MHAANALFRQAAAFNSEGRFELAEGVYREIMERWPDDPRAPYTLSTHLLSRGAYEEGWALYESRSLVPETGIKRPRVSYPEWDGADVGSLLIFPEQGLGDQIMFARYIPLLVARGIRVTLLCSPTLVRLFAGLGAQVVPASGEVTLPRHDAWCLIGSLPHHVGGIPPAPYLPGTQDGAGTGLCTHGNPKHVNDANRSMPDSARSLLKDGWPFISLHPEDSGVGDFQESADLLNQLNLVVSVDTSVAHLAGAVGKETWLLLPAIGTDWRWGRFETSTPWYPTMRIIRQGVAETWEAVARRVLSDLGTIGENSPPR
jgi:hypothetical protein